jgi:hypothetical protein
MVKKEAVTFLKKSNQKTFAQLDRGVFNAWGPVSKSFFASFFSKKEALALATTAPSNLLMRSRFHRRRAVHLGP